jgi:hypothetical protein
VRLWRKSGPPEPAVALSAAAGARNGSAQDRYKGDAQEVARQRLVVASAIFALAFVAVGLRMGYVSMLRDGAEPTQRVAARGGAIQAERGDIVDRNGIVLATSVPVMSAFANPRLVLDPQEAARKIATALPEFKLAELREKLDADKTFVWIKRGLSPREHDLVNRLGIPGLDFQAEERRIYPQGTAAAHIVGYASRCSSPSTFACSAWSRPSSCGRSRNFRRSAPRRSCWTRPTARSSPWPRCRATTPTRPRPSPTRRCSTARRSASTSRARPSRSSTTPWRSTAARRA